MKSGLDGVGERVAFTQDAQCGPMNKIDTTTPLGRQQQGAGPMKTIASSKQFGQARTDKKIDTYRYGRTVWRDYVASATLCGC